MEVGKNNGERLKKKKKKKKNESQSGWRRRSDVKKVKKRSLYNSSKLTLDRVLGLGYLNNRGINLCVK